MLYGAKRGARKLLSSWPGRLLTLTVAIFLVCSIVSTFIELKDNAVRSRLTTVAMTGRVRMKELNRARMR